MTSYLFHSANKLSPNDKLYYTNHILNPPLQSYDKFLVLKYFTQFFLQKNRKKKNQGKEELIKNFERGVNVIKQFWRFMCKKDPTNYIITRPRARLMRTYQFVSHVSGHHVALASNAATFIACFICSAGIFKLYFYFENFSCRSITLIKFNNI